MIDIIIPVYNSRRTICKTLNSILDQEYNEKIVVYFIDDASTESYDEIINFYSNYLNIKYYKLNENSGPGVARQFGIEKSTNEYIVFIDSDDVFYDSNSIKKLYDSLYGYDMVFGKMVEKKYNSSSDYFHGGCLHGKMYRRSFIYNNNIKFNNLRSHEDNAFNQLYLSLSHNVNYLDEKIYIYNYNEHSITNSESSLDSLNRYIDSMTWLFDEIEKRENINRYRVGLNIMNILCYCYFNYLLDENENQFVFKKLKNLKKMYYKYIDYITFDDKLNEYKSFNYPVIPSITFDDFIKKID